ncbi:mesoderm posterior protein 2-like [Conger conger]|uniref:mesoderm posterior protein 2-like n=1 Tax=Conger conger TaxID=82655 RepID=UPI002A5991BD|nr:mesoderm posterior protein 2-like [Conger conger]
MDAALSQFLLQETRAPGCGATLEQACSGSDPGYHSACGSLSPASSVDSLCLSPPPADSLVFSAAATETGPRPAPTARPARPSRSRYPGHKRQSASEREKLRMRDLTKALQRLNAYLPPSLAPTGQTLTKIQTLRLTISYIAQLSAQLEGVPSQACPELSPSCSGAQEDDQRSFCQSTEQAAVFQPALSHSMDQYSCLRQPYQVFPLLLHL